jgi:type II secretory pathway pseudopilin PulG
MIQRKKGYSSNTHQRGAVLIILVMLMVLALSTALLTGISTTKTKLAQSSQTRLNLAEAKSAVIAYARLSDPDKTSSGLNLRYLPCPDTNGDGLEETPCGTNAATGWLPWQTLGIPALKDSSGYCFRYFVAAAYKRGTAIPPDITALPPAEFQVYNHQGALISNDVIAMIFAVNEPVAGQRRNINPGVATECGSTALGAAINQDQNLLESINGISNASAPQFIVAPEGSSSTFNDTAIWISRTEL